MFIVQLQTTTNSNDLIQTSYAFCGGGQRFFWTNKEIEMGRDTPGHIGSIFGNILP